MTIYTYIEQIDYHWMLNWGLYETYGIIHDCLDDCGSQYKGRGR